MTEYGEKRIKELRRELRRVRSRETEILIKSRYASGINLESLLSRYVPDTLESTLDAAFREAFKLIFSKGTALIGKTFNEEKLRRGGGSDREAQRQLARDLVLTGVEGTGLGLMGVGLPDIAVFTGMLLRAVYQTAISNHFEYTTKTEQMFILRLIEAALAKGREAEELSGELDSMMRRIDEEGYRFYGSMNPQIEKTSKALSDETLYLKFIQTVPVVGVAGGLSNPIYLNKVKKYADVKYRKRRLMMQLREMKKLQQEQPQGEQAGKEAAGKETHEVEALGADMPEAESHSEETLGVDMPEVESHSEADCADGSGQAAERSIQISVYDPDHEE